MASLRLGGSALSFRDQIDVTHHASVMHFAVPVALCDFFTQVRQPNIGSITRNQILYRFTVP
jgi:hypothetical protein